MDMATWTINHLKTTSIATYKIESDSLTRLSELTRIRKKQREKDGRYCVKPKKEKKMMVAVNSSRYQVALPFGER